MSSDGYDIEGAWNEIRENDYHEIQRKTAIKWAGRAIAAYLMSLEDSDIHDSYHLLELGNEYAHEAIEHAALVEDGGELLERITQDTAEHKEAAVSGLFSLANYLENRDNDEEIDAQGGETDVSSGEPSGSEEPSDTDGSPVSDKEQSS